ncbi:hypothetical protein C8Q73DRAFT_782828 [Cubamyces lactineus]|nr:hypothetical protein C8Q73DRAFT_782828 [Cubamyces lactineus]
MEESQHIRYVPTRDFLDKIMSVDSGELALIYDAVMQHKDKPYACKRWQWFPRAEAQYEDLDVYPAFTETANAIAKVAREVVGEHEDQVREATWVHSHANVPQTHEKDAALTRPRCALAMASADASKAPSQKSNKVHWLQFVAAVEAKRESGQKDKELISQLLACLGVMMVEQRVRRFALGLFLSSTQVSVWLQDRSGALGMDVPIDIHENPRDFIQVIAAFAILPAHRLGFDPTMKLAREPLPPIHIYRFTSQGPDGSSREECKTTNRIMQWVITTEHGDFMTLRTISLRTDMASGSGCIIWAVIRYEDRAVDPDVRKVFVLKQLWRSDGLVDEGAIHEHLKSASGDPDAQYIGDFEFHEVVKIGGEIDSTAGLIRRGLEPARVEAEERSMQVTSRAVARRRRKMKAPEKRTRVRIVLGFLGCPIELFSSVRELVSLLLDCVRGHRFAYKHGVVHRDISAGNLLIALKGREISPSAHSEPQDVRGCLIDFDHAKRTRTVEERTVQYVVEDVRQLIDMDVFRVVSSRWAEHVTDEVALRAVHLVKHRYPNESSPGEITIRATIYIRAGLEYYKLSGRAPPPGNVYTPEALGWDGPLLLPPEPIRRHVPERRGEVRSGTLPFISVKILRAPNQVAINWRRSLIPPSNVVHDAIHDMESLFWVLLFLCITRAGPGGERREDFVGELTDFPNVRQDQVARLRNVVRNLFDGDMATIASYKELLFLNPENFETEIFCHIHPYFEVLKPTLRRWWNLLVLAYAFEGYEYHNIHALVIELLDDAARNLVSPDDSLRAEDAKCKEDSQNAVEKRVNFLHAITHAVAASQASRPSSSPDIKTLETKKTPHQHSSPLSSPPQSPPAKRLKLGH